MTTAAIVLAAGSATRFGATKQVARLRGRPLVAHVVATASAADVDEVVVVVGHDEAAVRAALPDDRAVRAVVNEDHRDGMSASLRAGVGALGDDVDVAVVLLADQPGISPAAVRAVVAAVGDHDAARAVYEDGPAHPVAFARRTFPRLADLRGDQGARRLLDVLDVVDVDVGGATPPDVDTPADLDGLRR